MKKAILAVAVTLALAGCSKEIVYLDSKTGEPVEPSQELIEKMSKKKAMPDLTHKYTMVCIGHIRHWIDKRAFINKRGDPNKIVPYTPFLALNEKASGSSKDSKTRIITCNVEDD